MENTFCSSTYAVTIPSWPGVSILFVNELLHIVKFVKLEEQIAFAFSI